VSWDNGPWSVVLGNSYQSSYTDAQCDFTDTHSDPDCEAAAGGGLKRTVSSMSLWDLQTSWKGFKGLQLTLGVKNLLDTDPPKTNQQNSFQLGFDPSYYDPRGRVVYVQATYKFK
jgi:iron complex outermembrane receptor protein